MLSLGNSPYPKEVTIGIKAKALTTATVTQPATNLQKCFPDTCTIEKNSTWTVMSSTSCHRNLQSLVDLFHISLCSVIGDHMDEQWERTIWDIKECHESLQNPGSRLTASDKNLVTATLISTYSPCVSFITYSVFLMLMCDLASTGFKFCQGNLLLFLGY